MYPTVQRTDVDNVFQCAGRAKSLKQTTLWSATGKVRKRKDFVRSVCVMIRDYLVRDIVYYAS